MSTSTASKTEITLKGSVEIVSDFFFTAINSILYQRGEFSLFVSPCPCSAVLHLYRHRIVCENIVSRSNDVGTNTILILWLFCRQAFTCPRRSNENPSMDSLF